MTDKHVSPFQARMDAAKADAIMRWTGGGTTKPQIKSEPEINAESNIVSTPIPATIRIKKEKVADAAVSLLDLPAADEPEPEPSVTNKNPYAGLTASRKRKHPNQAPSSPTQVEEDLLSSQDEDDEHESSLSTRRIKRKNISMGINAAGSSSSQQPTAQPQPRPFAPAKKTPLKKSTPLTT